MEIITRIDAAKRGLKRYYTGKPCKHGHDSERWVYNGHCVECTMESNRRIRAEIKQIMINSSPTTFKLIAEINHEQTCNRLGLGDRSR